MNEAVFTWLQLSDMHVRLDRKTDHRRSFDALRRDVAHLADEGVHPDAIFLVGDIAHGGEAEQYDLAWELLEPVFEAAGVPPDQVFVVAGNHDVDRSRTDKSIERDFVGLWKTGELRAATDRVFDGEDAATLERKFNAYRRFARRVAPVRSGGLETWTKVLDIGGHKVAIYGLNSSWLCGADELDATGVPVIGQRQRELLDEMAGVGLDADLCLVLQHHPAEALNHTDANQHISWLAQKHCICLSGHVHQSSNTQVTTPEGGYLISTGGALYEDYEPPKRYLWGRVDLERNTTWFGLRRMADTFYVADSDRHLSAPTGLLTFDGPAVRGDEEARRTEMRIVLDLVELTYHPETDRYTVRFTKHVANDTDEPQVGVFARIAVNAFPNDNAKSREHYRQHPLELAEIAFASSCDVRDLECSLMRDEDSNKEMMLRFVKDGEDHPLEPGEEATVVYEIDISSSQWGPFLERHVRSMTDRLICRLRFPAGSVSQVVSVDNPHLQRSETSQEGNVVLAEEDGVDVYEWERISPARNARHRLVWTFA